MNIPGYKILSKLGQGGMASVYLALQESLDREVALKVMDPKMADDTSFCDRFIKEGKIVAQLSNHPDIVTIFDIGQVGGQYYMAMEYIPGANLKDRIYGNDNPKHPLLVIRQVASALEMAHSNGFIHRDVKPANILFKANGDAILSDFGIAKVVQAETQLTAIGYAVGTPEYMSPEQAMGQPVDLRADLYCLGVVLFEMLEEKKPYLGQDPFSTALMHINNPIPELSEKNAQYTDLLNRLMAKNRDSRFQTAEEVIAEIDKMMGTMAVAHVVGTELEQASLLGSAVSLIADGGSAESAPPSKLPLIIISVLGVSLLAAGSAYFYQNQQSLSSVAPIISEPTAARMPVLNQEQQESVDRLLKVAEMHMLIGRLKEPPGSNANEAYEMVLKMDPNNQTAKEALLEIEKQSE